MVPNPTHQRVPRKERAGQAAGRWAVDNFEHQKALQSIEFNKMYILDHSEQAELVRGLVLIETLDDGWSWKYRDPITGESWLEAFVSIGYGGTSILRKDPPPATIAEWIEKCFSSNRQEDLVGLALELSEKYDTWAEVIEYLEVNKERFETGKLAKFIERLTVLNPRNRRPILNKPYTEIEKDYQYFRDLSERAKRLLNPA